MNSSINIQSAIDRLNKQLPLQARQNELPPSLKCLHQSILDSLVTRGAALTHAEMIDQLGQGAVAEALQRLRDMDLVVLNKTGTAVMGAYPITTEKTPHLLTIEAHSVYAMCALDALAVAPMFSVESRIVSSCHVSSDPVRIHMQVDDIVAVEPAEVVVGIAWQMPCGVAAHSMCTEMVFLNSPTTASQWQAETAHDTSVFNLADAVAFAERFFKPLLDHKMES